MIAASVLALVLCILLDAAVVDSYVILPAFRSRFEELQANNRLSEQLSSSSSSSSRNFQNYSKQTSHNLKKNETQDKRVARIDINADDLIQRIESCKNGRDVSDLIRARPFEIFSSDTTSEIFALYSKIGKMEQTLKNRDISGLLNTLSKVRVHGLPSHGKKAHRSLMVALSNSSIRRFEDFDARDISMIANALARTNTYNEDVFNRAAKSAIEKIDTFTPQGLANLANAFAKMNHRHTELFDRIAASAIPIILSFKAQGLAIIVNAFAKMDHRHHELFDTISIAAIQIMDTFEAQGLACIANAFAKTDHHHPELFNKIATSAIPILDTFTAQGLANMVNAFAKINNHNIELFDRISEAAILRIGAFNQQSLANTVNAFGKMNHRSLELFNKIAAAAIPIIGTFNAQSLANMVNAFAKIDHRHPELFDRVAAAAIPIIGTFNAQELANTVNAFAKMNHPHPMLFDEVAAASISIIETFSEQALANTLSAFAMARMHSKQSNDLFSSVAHVLTSETTNLSKWDDRHLAEVAYACLKVNFHDQALLDSIGFTLSKKEKIDLDAREIGNLAAAFKKHETPSSSTVLKKIFSKFQYLDANVISLQSVADVARAMPMAERLNVVSQDDLKWLVSLAISKSCESRPEDVRDIILHGFCHVNLPYGLWNDLLLSYQPYFEKYYGEIMSEKNRLKVLQIYEESGISVFLN